MLFRSNDTATTEIYTTEDTLSLHDALPIYPLPSLPENVVSELLSTAEFALWAQGELSVTKSGTFMAFAAHSLNIVSCYAGAAKPEPLSLLISPSELMKGITKTELQARAARLREWQERTSAWPRIASEIARALEMEIPKS